MLSVPAFSDWGSVHYTMAAYVAQGIFIILLNTPLIVALMYRKKNRDRKEFVLIACVSIIDIFYVVVNSWNSFIRLGTRSESITRADCIIQPMYFISLVASQLVANMPLMVAFDRLIAALYGVWYYKQRHIYTLMLCAIPIAFSFVITLVNLVIILTTPAGEERVPSLCFTSVLPAPVYKMTYHGIKWGCIILAALVYAGVAYVLLTKKNPTSSAVHSKRIRTANLVMAISTVNSVLFHLVPDFLLVVPVFELTIFFQAIFFSCILNKIMINFFLFMFFHTELRTIYLQQFFRAKKASRRGTNSSGVVPTTSTRMFSQGSSGFLSRLALQIRSRFTQ